MSKNREILQLVLRRMGLMRLMVHARMLISCCQKPNWFQLQHSFTGGSWPKAQQAARDQLHWPFTATRAFRSNPLCYGPGVCWRQLGVVNILQPGLSEVWQVNGLWTASQFDFRPDREDTVTSSYSQSFLNCFHVSLLTVQVLGWSITRALRLFCETFPGVNLFQYLRICSCHRGEPDLGFKWSLQDVSSGFALWLLCSRKNSQAVQRLAQCWIFFLPVAAFHFIFIF